MGFLEAWIGVQEVEPGFHLDHITVINIEAPFRAKPMLSFCPCNAFARQTILMLYRHCYEAGGFAWIMQSLPRCSPQTQPRTVITPRVFVVPHVDGGREFSDQRHHFHDRRASSADRLAERTGYAEKSRVGQRDSNR
jgi:hypothetical protein